MAGRRVASSLLVRAISSPPKVRFRMRSLSFTRCFRKAGCTAYCCTARCPETCFSTGEPRDFLLLFRNALGGDRTAVAKRFAAQLAVHFRRPSPYVVFSLVLSRAPTHQLASDVDRKPGSRVACTSGLPRSLCGRSQGKNWPNLVKGNASASLAPALPCELANSNSAPRGTQLAGSAGSWLFGVRWPKPSDGSSRFLRHP